jgi:hypothetical protein
LTGARRHESREKNAHLILGFLRLLSARSVLLKALVYSRLGVVMPRRRTRTRTKEERDSSSSPNVLLKASPELPWWADEDVLLRVEERNASSGPAGGSRALMGKSRRMAELNK